MRFFISFFLLIATMFGGEELIKYTGSSQQIKYIEQMIKERKSFVLTTVKDFGDIVAKLEKFVEENDMTCRVYTKKRSALIVTIPAILLHDILTFDPDYEIAKDRINHRIYVDYKN